MSEMPDIAKVVSLIMSNPKLMEEISALSKSAPPAETAAEELPPAEAVEETVSASAPTYDFTPSPPPPRGKRDRTVLLDALRPYVSHERQHAIDTMLTLADVFDAVRRKS